MTISVLALDLEVNAGGFHQAMESVAQQAEKTSKQVGQSKEVFEAVTKSMEKYNQAIGQLNANAAILGPEFNKNAASAAALKDQIDAIVKAGGDANTVLPDGTTLSELAKRYVQLAQGGTLYQQALNVLGPTLEDHARLLDVATKLGINLDTITAGQLTRLKAYATQLGAVTGAFQTALAGGFDAIGKQLGNMLDGAHHSWKDFGKLIAGVLGTMLTTLGHALIAYGVAGVVIKKFITNPFAAIAAGIALVALGNVLSKAAASTVSSGGKALASGGSASGGGSGNPDSGGGGGGQLQQSGTIVIQGGLLDMSDPRQANALSEALEQLSGRRVVIRGATA